MVFFHYVSWLPPAMLEVSWGLFHLRGSITVPRDGQTQRSAHARPRGCWATVPRPSPRVGGGGRSGQRSVSFRLLSEPGEVFHFSNFSLLNTTFSQQTKEILSHTQMDFCFSTPASNDKDRKCNVENQSCVLNLPPCDQAIQQVPSPWDSEQKADAGTPCGCLFSSPMVGAAVP